MGRMRRPSHGTSRPIGRAVGRHHDLVAPQDAPGRLDARNPCPGAPRPRTVVAPCSTAPDAAAARARPAASLAGWSAGAAFDEQAAAEPTGADLAAQLGGVEEPGLFADRGVGSGDGALVRRRHEDGGPAPRGRVRCQSNSMPSSVAETHQRLRRRRRSRPRAAARRARRGTPTGRACPRGAPCRRCDCSPRTRCRHDRGRRPRARPGRARGPSPVPCTRLRPRRRRPSPAAVPVPAAGRSTSSHQ